MLCLPPRSPDRRQPNHTLLCHERPNRVNTTLADVPGTAQHHCIETPGPAASPSSTQILVPVAIGGLPTPEVAFVSVASRDGGPARSRPPSLLRDDRPEAWRVPFASRGGRPSSQRTCCTRATGRPQLQSMGSYATAYSPEAPSALANVPRIFASPAGRLVDRLANDWYADAPRATVVVRDP